MFDNVAVRETETLQPRIFGRKYVNLNGAND
jgi:hypothetical protein